MHDASLSVHDATHAHTQGGHVRRTRTARFTDGTYQPGNITQDDVTIRNSLGSVDLGAQHMPGHVGDNRAGTRASDIQAYHPPGIRVY
jgi:hypothetical protein